MSQTTLVSAINWESYYRDNNIYFSTKKPEPVTCSPVGATSISIEQKITQTFIVGFAPTDTEAMHAMVAKYKIGGLFPVGSGDNSKLTKSFFDELSVAAGTKLFIAADDEGGQVSRFTEGILDSASTMSNLTDTEIEAKGKAAGEKLQASGLTGDLAPVLDLTQTKDVSGKSVPDDGFFMTRQERTWGSNPVEVTKKVGAFTKGLKSAGITPVYKHFPGIGKVKISTDEYKTAPLSLAELEEGIEPYKTLANQNGAAIMLSNSYITEWGDTPASINQKAVDYLRDEIGFKGTIMTDALNVYSSYSSGVMDIPAAVTAALDAGVDMPLFIPQPDQVDAVLQASIDAVKKDVSAEKINAAYAKSLALRGLPVPSSSTTNVSCCTSSNPNDSVILNGDNNTEKILSFLMNNAKYKFTLSQAAGLVGNFFVEAGGSNEDGTIPESSMLKGPNPGARSKPDDSTMTFGYYGIAQWGNESGGSGTPTRWSGPKGLKTFAESQGKPWDELEVQLRFMAWELGIGEVWNGDEGGSESGALEAIKGLTEPNAETAGKVAFSFEAKYERCGCTQEKRAQAGRDVYTYYADKAALPGAGTTAPPAASSPASACASNGTGTGVAAGDFVFYTQWDPKSTWFNKSYWGSTYANAGCGPTGVAMIVATWKDKTIIPSDVGSWIEGPDSPGVDPGVGAQMPLTFAHYGLTAKGISSMDEAVAGLKAGGMVIMSAAGSAPFTSGGHYIVLRGITPDGQVLMGNPNAGAPGSGYNREEDNIRPWDPKEIVTASGGNFNSMNLVTKVSPDVSQN